MKIRKGLPPGYMPVPENLQPLVERLKQLPAGDIGEVSAFIDYLQRQQDPDKVDSLQQNKNLKLYDFMQGGIDEDEPAEDRDSTDPD